MIFNRIPCIYMPTQVVMVDDNQSFLENVRLSIHDYQEVISYCDPISALNKLTTYKPILNSSNIFNNISYDELDDKNIVSVDYKNLASLLNFKHEISLLIVDYSMPEINGIDFFNKLKTLPVKKIMLTGEADNNIAVEAFNEGLIDHFIIKGIENGIDNLNYYVNKCKQHYFIDSKLNQLISINSPIKETSDYINLVNKWIKDFIIARFFQFNQYGSLIGFDKQNRTYAFYIIKEEDFATYFEIAESQGADERLLGLLAEKKMVPVFISDESMKLPVSQWDSLLYPVEGCFEFNLEKYYFCCVDV